MLLLKHYCSFAWTNDVVNAFLSYSLRIVQGAHLSPFLVPCETVRDILSKFLCKIVCSNQKHHLLELCRVRHAPHLTNVLLMVHRPHAIPPDDFKKHISSHSMVWSEKVPPQKLPVFPVVKYLFWANFSYSKWDIDPWRCVMWCR